MGIHAEIERLAAWLEAVLNIVRDDRIQFVKDAMEGVWNIRGGTGIPDRIPEWLYNASTQVIEE